MPKRPRENGKQLREYRRKLEEAKKTLAVVQKSQVQLRLQIRTLDRQIKGLPHLPFMPHKGKG